MLIVALGLDFWLGRSCRFSITGSRGVWSPCIPFSIDGSWNCAVETFLLLFLCNSFAGLLVSQLCGSRVVAPAMPSLLVMFAKSLSLACGHNDKKWRKRYLMPVRLWRSSRPRPPRPPAPRPPRPRPRPRKSPCSLSWGGFARFW
jgi:hypothetical protein